MEERVSEVKSTLFKSYILNKDGINKAQQQGLMFEEFHNSLHALTFDGVDSDKPFEGREWAIVKTKLEEAAFFAKKAMAVQTKNQANVSG